MGRGHPPDRSVVTFDEGDVDGETFAVLHPRHNLHDGAEVLFSSFVAPQNHSEGYVLSVLKRLMFAPY